MLCTSEGLARCGKGCGVSGTTRAWVDPDDVFVVDKYDDTDVPDYWTRVCCDSGVG